MLTIGEVAGRLGLSGGAVRRLVARGELAHHRFGRCIRIAEWDLDELVRRSRVEGRPDDEDLSHLTTIRVPAGKGYGR
jgi:excisionase family DNA binding protein